MSTEGPPNVGDRIDTPRVGEDAKTPQETTSTAQRSLEPAQAQVDEVVEIMHENVKKLAERGTKLSELDDKAKALEEGGSKFAKQGEKLKRKFWLKNLKMMIIMGIIGLLFIIIIGVSIFGGGSYSSD